MAGRYQIVRLLGAGGMGKVWLAEDETLRRRVAIKEVTVPVGIAESERQDLATCALREARAAAQLNHPNVIRIYDVGPDADRPWIVMEYVPSRSLLQVIREHGALPVPQVARIGLAVLSALVAARRAGVLHHDVKPSNVLIADDGRVVLTDFGSAVIDGGAVPGGGPGVVLGSPHYVAPERVRHRISTAESDMWSLGATLFHAVEGRPPYDCGSVPEILAAVADRDPEPARRAGPLEPVLRGLLQRDPQRRMRPEEAELQLSRLAAGRSTRVPRQRRPEDVPARRPPGWRLTAVAAVVMLTMLAVFATTTGRRPWSWADTPRNTVATSPARPAAAPTSAPTVTPAVLPRGFTWRTARDFRVAVPTAWSVRRQGAETVFRAPGNWPTLRVRSWQPARRDAESALLAEEKRTRLPGYRRLGIAALPDGLGATWEYIFRDPTLGRVHSLDRVVVQDGTQYLLQWRTPAGSWATHLNRLDVALRTFEAARGAPVRT